MGALYPPLIVDAPTRTLSEVYLTMIRCHNQGAIAVSTKRESHSLMKHVNEDFVREKVEDGEFVVRLEQHRVMHGQFFHLRPISLIGEDYTVELLNKDHRKSSVNFPQRHNNMRTPSKLKPTYKIVDIWS